MMIVNFKNYRQGKGVVRLVDLIEKYNEKAVICLGASDLHLARDVKLKVFAQHVDYQGKGRSTGLLIPEAIKASGAKGSLLNHSEHRVSFGVIEKTLRRCDDLNLKVIVCVSSLGEARKIRKLKPYGVAFEDPLLIESGRSITKHGSGRILNFVNLLKGTGIVPICGAGISGAEDYVEALELGCGGVLISSAVVKTGNPVKLLRDISKW